MPDTVQSLIFLVLLCGTILGLISLLWTHAYILQQFWKQLQHDTHSLMILYDPKFQSIRPHHDSDALFRLQVPHALSRLMHATTRYEVIAVPMCFELLDGMCFNE